MALTIDPFKVPINTDLDLGIMGGQRENCAFNLRTLSLGAKYPNVPLFLKKKQKTQERLNLSLEEKDQNRCMCTRIGNPT